MLNALLGFGFFSWALKISRNFWLQLQLALFKRQQRCQLDSNSSGSGALSRLIGRESSRNELEAAANKDIPTVKGLPLIGTLLELVAAGGAPQLHNYVDGRHQQFGSIFRERLGGTQDAVFVSSASLMRAVFFHEGLYPRHPLPDAWTMYNKTHNCQRGLFFMDGVEWLHNRRLLSRFLLNGNLEWMNAHINACTEKLMNAWQRQAAAQEEGVYYEILNLEQQLYRWSIDVVCAIMFGANATRCQKIEFALDEFSKIVYKIFENSALLMNFPPQLAKLLNLKMWSEFESNVNEVLHKGSQIIDIFMALSTDEAVVKDADNQELFHKLEAAGMELSMIKRIFVDLVIAAGDTTAYSAEWALYLLGQDPHLQQSIAAEVYLNARSWPLVNGLMKETLRLYPVAPFIGRYLAADAEIGGYHIKKDTLVLLSLYTAGRSAEHFPNPLTVNPRRWLTHNSPDVLKAHGTLPFAIGQRSCIGKKIAVRQMHTLLAMAASKFEMKCTNAASIECVLRLVTVPSQPLQLAIKMR